MTVIYRHNQERRSNTMIKLYKFYELINRNATVTLASTKLDATYFEGSIKNIPDCYDDWKVTNFAVSNDGDFLFRIEK